MKNLKVGLGQGPQEGNEEAGQSAITNTIQTLQAISKMTIVAVTLLVQVSTSIIKDLTVVEVGEVVKEHSRCQTLKVH